MSDQRIVESLERRTFLSVAQINFPDFSNSTHLVENGYDSAKVIVANKLRLTDNDFHQARSIWYDQAVPIEKFRTDFSFRVNQNTIGADGLTFAIINGPTSALGADGNSLGFAKINVPSEAVAFDQFNFGKFGTRVGFASNGQRPSMNETPKSIDLHSGHVFKVTVTYDGATMTAAIVDATTRGETYVTSKKINLTKQLETTDAIVGFTAGTGDNRSQQDILSWSFNGQHDIAPAPAPVPAPVPTNPTVALAASASPLPVRTRTTTLNVLGADSIDPENKLTYTWTATQLPNGARTPLFAVNGTNAAKSTIARFYKAGNYRFRATITNSAGLSSTSDVTVRVVSAATYVGIDRHQDEIDVGTKAQYHAKMYDQFRRELRVQPAFTWSVIEGPGTIDADSGLFKAGKTTGHVVVAATALGLTGTVGAVVMPV